MTGSIKSEDFMKNKIMFILTFVATVGLVGNAFANRTDSNSYITGNGYSHPAVISAVPNESPVPIKIAGVWRTITKERVSLVNTAVPIGMATSKKDIGGLNQDNIGVVTSINPRNNVVVIDNKHCPKTSVVSTDDATIASLQLGQTVYAKMSNMSGNRAEIVGFGR